MLRSERISSELTDYYVGKGESKKSMLPFLHLKHRNVQYIPASIHGFVENDLLSSILLCFTVLNYPLA